MARFHTTEQKARYAQKAKAKRLAEKESALKAQRHKVNDARRQRNYAARLKAQGKVPVGAKTVSFVEDKAATPLVFQDVDRATANIAPPAKVAPTPTPATIDSLPATPVGHKVTNSHSKTAPSHLQRYGMTSQQRFEILVCLFIPFSPLSGRLLGSSSLRRQGAPLNPQHYSRPLMILSMTRICESSLVVHELHIQTLSSF
mmetsp:Transcript_11973/g.21785  ORF Transcript_11973/g.21785 Transcript_11973/m.21785 type:complete len:201 (+) Transcript_11973:376-978(+)